MDETIQRATNLVEKKSRAELHETPSLIKLCKISSTTVSARYSFTLDVNKNNSLFLRLSNILKYYDMAIRW
jgi:hypothetical protein